MSDAREREGETEKTEKPFPNILYLCAQYTRV